MKKCKNCGAAVEEKYCPSCGQKYKALTNPRLSDLFHEAFHELIHIDNKIYKTLWTLFRYPGLLTKDFLQGRRASYIGPMRLYLTLSIVYFLVSAVLPGDSITPRYSLKDEKKTSGGKDTGVSAGFELEATGDDIQSNVSFLSKDFNDTVKRGVNAASVDKQKFAHAFHTTLPKALFLLLPLFAGMLWISYWGRRKNYPQYLYFSIHLHAAIFGGLIVVSLMRQLPFSAFFGAYFFWTIWAFSYFVFGLRRVWGDTKNAALFRAFTISFIYIFLIAALFLSLVVYVLYSIGKTVPAG